MINNLPWNERINMISINPEAATITDVAQLAADLNDKIVKSVKIKFLAEKGLKSLNHEKSLRNILLAIIKET